MPIWKTLLGSCNPFRPPEDTGLHIMNALRIPDATVGKSARALGTLTLLHSLLALLGLVWSKPKYKKFASFPKTLDTKLSSEDQN